MAKKSNEVAPATRMHKMLLMQARCSLQELTDRLSRLPRIEDVYTNNDDLGYILRLRFKSSVKPGAAVSYVSDNIPRSFGKLITCY